MVRQALAAFTLAFGAIAALSQTPAEQAARELAARYQKEHDDVIRMFRADPDYEEADQVDVLFFYSGKEGRTYLVTKPGHLAHPAVVIRRVVPMGAGLFVESDGIGRGDQLALRRWLMELDAQAREEAERKRERRAP